MNQGCNKQILICEQVREMVGSRAPYPSVTVPAEHIRSYNGEKRKNVSVFFRILSSVGV